VFLTGGTGFIGSHVLDALVDSGFRVRALSRREQAISPRSGVEVIRGELSRSGDLVPALRGCRYLVHVAALYTFAPRQSGRIWTTNVQGTRSILEAARIAGCEKAVVTSSSATVGPGKDGRPATEESWVKAAGRRGTLRYHVSKVLQERAALAARIPTVLVLPSAPVGPRDWKPTPTGKMILDFMKGRIFASFAGGLNLVPVEDVARGHVLALQHGADRERYLLGGENFKLAHLWRVLARICGRRPPAFELPYPIARALAVLDEVRCRLIGDADPLIPLEGVQMARHDMFISSDKAKRELSYVPGPVEDALRREVSWYHENGYA